MNKAKKEILEEANQTDWMKYIDAAQSIAHVHGMNKYEGQIIGDWLSKALDQYAEKVLMECIYDIGEIEDGNDPLFDVYSSIIKLLNKKLDKLRKLKDEKTTTTNDN